MPPPDLGKVDFTRMDPAEFVRMLARLGIRLDLEELRVLAGAAFERFAAAMRQGVELAPGADRSLDKGTDSAFDRALEAALKGIGGGVREDLLRRVRADEIWIAVADGNTCEDCLERHADVKTHEEWLRAGPPRSAALQCGKRCRCELLPYRGDKDAPDPLVQLEAYL